MPRVLILPSLPDDIFCSSASVSLSESSSRSLDDCDLGQHVIFLYEREAGVITQREENQLLHSQFTRTRDMAMHRSTLVLTHIKSWWIRVRQPYLLILGTLQWNITDTCPGVLTCKMHLVPEI